MPPSSRPELAAKAAEIGADQAMHEFRTTLEIESKASKTDLVTEVDRSVQKAVIEQIRRAYPGDPIVAEEGNRQQPVPDEGPAWVIDPIDGTTNFARGLRQWATSIAVVEDGTPIAASTVMPALEDSFVVRDGESSLNGDAISVSDRADPATFLVAVLGWAPDGDHSRYVGLAGTAIEQFNDIRRIGCMQAALAHVATGGLDAAITTEVPYPWDSIAGAHLIECAGGTVTDPEGEPWDHANDVMVASNGQAHEEILAMLDESSIYED
ncbi:MAG: inositol monophosphatase [Halobacteriales archaeon]